MNPTLSIVVAAHREGLIAHKTMLSIERAIKSLQESNIPFEVIVTIDNGDSETIEYFDRYKKENTISVHEVTFGELASSRNYGISLAKGSYIAIVDADDLVSENWFLDSISLLQSRKDPAVLHTHYSVNFGTQDIVWEKFDSRSKEEDAIIMTWANRWDSAIITTRDVLAEFPYQPNSEGFGSEDWHFNSQTLAANIPHIVTPETILFVRRKDASMMTRQAADRRTVRFTDLLDFAFMGSIDTSSFSNRDNHDETSADEPSLTDNIRSLGIKGARHLHRKAKRSQLYTRTSQKILSHCRTEGEQSNTSSRFPKWLTDEWLKIHQLEKGIFPDKKLLKSIPLYHSEMYELGLHYSEIVRNIPKNIDYLMFVPILSRGGAELVALRYINTIRKAHPDWNIAVIATEPGENPWQHNLDKNISFVSFGNITGHLSEDLRLQLLARIIVQAKVSRIHIAQSPLMFRFASLYEKLLSPITVYAFAFCEDKDNQGRISGHVHSGLPFAFKSITTILTDCNAITESLTREYGYTHDKFITHYQPVSTTLTKPTEASDEKLRVLWASRIAKQKKPDILVEVSKKLSHTNIQIDVYGSFQDGFSQDIFNNIRNISYKGGFDGIDTIPTENYDVFMYTSENDGMPNIILEATAKGLLVVAPTIGGISEFINNKNGYLIKDNEDVDAYATALTNILSIPQAERQKRINLAQRKLESQHSLDGFEKNVTRDIT